MTSGRDSGIIGEFERVGERNLREVGTSRDTGESRGEGDR